MSTQLILLLAVFSRVVSSSNDCHACLVGVCYSKTTILEGYRFSGQLAIDRIENIVYFHYEDSQSIDYTAAFDLDDIRVNILPNIDFSFARAVDQSNRDVYIGGARGIYKYNPNSNNTIQYGLFDKTIRHMQYKNKLYYTVLQTKGLYTFGNKKSKSIHALSNYIIDDFIIDNRGDIYFLSESYVYRLENGANQTHALAADIYSLSIDKFGVAHFMHSGKRGVYTLDNVTEHLYVMGSFGNGLPVKYVFDNNNNIIYYEHNSRKLYYLMPNYGRCMVSMSQGIKKPKKAQDENEMDHVIIHRFS